MTPLQIATTKQVLSLVGRTRPSVPFFYCAGGANGLPLLLADASAVPADQVRSAILTAQRKVFRRTMSELQNLNARELADLGIDRSQITSIALFLMLYSAGRWGSEPWRNRVRAVAVLAVLVILGIGVNEERQLLDLGVLTFRSYVLASLVGILGNLGEHLS